MKLSHTIVVFFLIIGRVVIKGEPNDDAVLCTDDMTFELRTAETSNALLVVPHLLCPNDPGTTHTHTHVYMYTYTH